MRNKKAIEMKTKGVKMKDIALELCISYEYTKEITKNVKSPINTRNLPKKADIDTVHRLVLSGNSCSEVSKITGISLSRVKRYRLKARKANEL